MKCRHCKAALNATMANLDYAPPSNAYLSQQDLNRPELWLPLRIRVCEHCWLVQTEDFSAAQNLFTADYAYFSSTSTSWLRHAEQYVCNITEMLQLSTASNVIEIACNDGYLLKNFVAADIPCLGVEPTASTAAAARQQGIPVVEKFFGEETAKELLKEYGAADLLIANNVYAHIPDINDFTRGIKILLKAGGTATLEFQHLLNILKYNQFDTLYHEHFSYHSLFTVSKIMRCWGLRVYKVESLNTHGGSLRIYVCHDSDSRKDDPSVSRSIDEELNRGVNQLETYQAFQAAVESIKIQLLMFLLELKSSGKSIAAYGAAAKGNTLLNYAGVKTDLLPFVCDAAPSKQQKYLPGSHIPIVAPEILQQQPPDYLLLLPWNIATEIIEQLEDLRQKGTRFVTAIPELRVL